MKYVEKTFIYQPGFWSRTKDCKSTTSRTTLRKWPFWSTRWKDQSHITFCNIELSPSKTPPFLPQINVPSNILEFLDSLIFLASSWHLLEFFPSNNHPSPSCNQLLRDAHVTIQGSPVQRRTSKAGRGKVVKIKNWWFQVIPFEGKAMGKLWFYMVGVHGVHESVLVFLLWESAHSPV